ncbi:hypothetical protein ACIQ9J_01685 [Streptomyces sp. NPDC094153]|uniref:hypothetical protein n=1 Tax=Streptomyces sp. NPDC094153 TaxID=3366058 RepID=UPI003828609F
MSTNLTAAIDGQHVPLEECGWIESRPCGCIVAAAVAVAGHRVLATVEQAHRHLNPTKRDRDRAAKAGLTTELITMQHYRENIGAHWECQQHAPVEATP